MQCFPEMIIPKSLQRFAFELFWSQKTSSITFGEFCIYGLK